MCPEKELKGFSSEQLIDNLIRKAAEWGPAAQSLVIDPMASVLAEAIKELKEELLRRLKPLEPPEIKITRHRAGLDPAISVFHVVLTHKEGSWAETWGSKELLEAFIKGVKAGCEILNVYLPTPEIPEVNQSYNSK